MIDFVKRACWVAMLVSLCWAGVDGVVWADAAVSGTVWIDKNQNGKQDSSEEGEPFVIVELYEAGSSSAMLTTQTDFEGHYSFGAVVSGEYVVNVILPDYELGYAIPNRGDDDTIDSDVAVSGLSDPFTVGTEPVMIDAGFIQILDVISPVQGVVWTDVDGNGQRDMGEPLNSGITVTLYFTGTTLDEPFYLQETTTDDNGVYELPGISRGDYLIEFALPAEFTQFTVQNEGDDTADSDVDVNDGRTVVFFHDGVARDTRFDAGLMGDAIPTSVTLLPMRMNLPNVLPVVLSLCLCCFGTFRWWKIANC